MFGTIKFDTSGNLRSSFVSLEEKIDNNLKLRIAEVLLVLLIPVNGCKEEKEVAFVQYMDTKPQRVNKKWALECVNVQ